MPVQRELHFGGRGGKRAGAGRPRKLPGRVPHAPRARLSRHRPVHVTLRLRSGLPRLRRRDEYRALRRAFDGGRERFGFRLIQYSVQADHLHLIAEADGERSLARGIQGLSVRIARALNRLWRRRGKLFLERYHAHVLRTPLEVRRALVYVLQNARKHGGWLVRGAPDPYSSAGSFDGWRTDSPVSLQTSPVTTPRSGL